MMKQLLAAVTVALAATAAHAQGAPTFTWNHESNPSSPDPGFCNAYHINHVYDFTEGIRKCQNHLS